MYLAVAAYITAAYWFTASTSIANPAVICAHDLSRARAGENIELSTCDAQLLTADGWVTLVAEARDQAPRRSRRVRKGQSPA